MKKIFLFTLLTCFMCVNMWAEGNVAKIGDNEYATLQAAIAAVPETGVETEIVLINDVTVNAILTISSTRNIKLNLNGYGITSTYDCGEDMEDFDRDCIFLIKGTLHVISQGNAIVQRGVTTGSSTIFANQGTLIVDGGIFIGSYQDAYGWGFKMPVIWTDYGCSTTITGGTFLCNENFSDKNKGYIFGLMKSPLLDFGAPNYTITGGVFSTNEYENKPTSSYLAPYLGDDYTAIDVPYTNANIQGYSKATRPANYINEIKNVCIVVPKTNRLESTKAAPITLNSASGTTEANFVYVDPESTMTIENGATLKVGDAGIILGGTDAKLVIEAGATVISDGDIITSTDENIQLTMDARSDIYSTLAIKANNIQAKHPNATVTLNSVCVEKEDGTHAWQRFAIPTYLTNLKVSDMTANGDYTTRIFGWNYDDSGATDGGWQEKASSDALVPFQGYTMTVQDKGVTPNYTFKSELVGNGNPTIALHPKWNYLANSYTAPMSMGAILTDLYTNRDNLDVSAGVWAQEEPGSTNWKSIAYADKLFGEMSIDRIQPMQAFIFYNKSGSASEIEILYENYVYKPLVGQVSYAPARHQGVAEDITRAHVVIEDANGIQETVKLYLSDDFSAAEDPGFDIPKYINSDKFNFYAVTDLGDMERVASNNLDELALVLKTKDATSFTMKFESVSLEGYGILDKLTDTTTPIAEESEYAFTAEDNSTIADRFVVVKQTPTAIDNIVPAGAKNGYYSMTGVYMGEDFHALPAGMYIINGKKVVK